MDRAKKEPSVANTEISLIPETPADRWKYAETLANANLIPIAFRRRPADVFYAVEYGAMLGLSPIAALTGIHVIEGKPTASSALMSAMVRKNGHRLRVRVEGRVEDGTLSAVAELTRADDPEHTFVARWDLHRAQRAGLLSLRKEADGTTVVVSRSKEGKPQAWEKFPENMCKARAISEVSRDGAEECLFGMHYTPEELGADVDEDGDVVTVTVEGADVAPPAPDGKRRPEPAAPASTDVVDVETVDVPEPEVDWVTFTPDAVGKAAQDAAAAGDLEGLRPIWASAAQSSLMNAPVHRQIRPDWRAAIGMPREFTLGQWLHAVKAHLEKDSTSVKDLAALAATAA